MKKKKKSPKLTPEFLLDKYHNFCPSLPRCLKLTEERKRRIKTRLNEEDWFDAFLRVAPVAEELKRSNAELTWLNIDFLIRNNTNVYRILEGSYDWLKPALKSDEQEIDQTGLSKEEWAEIKAQIELSKKK